MASYRYKSSYISNIAILLINLLIIANCQGPPLDDDCVGTCCPDIIPSDDNITMGSVPGVSWVCCWCNEGFYLSQPCEHIQPNTRICSPCQFVEDDPHRQYYIDDGPHSRETCTKSIATCPHDELRVKGNTTSPATCAQVSSTQSNAVTTPGDVEPVQSGIFLSSGNIVGITFIIIIVVVSLVVLYCCLKRNSPCVHHVAPPTSANAEKGVQTKGQRAEERGRVQTLLRSVCICTRSEHKDEVGDEDVQMQLLKSSTSNNQAKNPVSDVTTDSIEAINGKPGTSGISERRKMNGIPDGKVIDDDDKSQTDTDFTVSNGDIKLSSIPDEQNSPHQSRSDQSAISSGAARKPSMEETQTESHGQTNLKQFSEKMDLS